MGRLSFNIGIEHIYLYDNDFDDYKDPGPDMREILSDYIAAGKITYVDYKNKAFNCTQLKAYNECISEAIDDGYDWLAYIDIDEFITLNADKYKCISDMLDQEKFRDADVVMMNWMVYGDNGLVHMENKPVYERFKEPIMPLDKCITYPNIAENKHIKSIVNLYKAREKGIRMAHVHYAASIYGNLRGMDCAGNAMKAEWPFSTSM